MTTPRIAPEPTRRPSIARRRPAPGPVGRRPFRSALAALLLAALLPASPVASGAPAADLPEAASPTSTPTGPGLPEPDLSALDEAPRRQLQQYRALVERLQRQSGSSPGLGLAVGELGALYLLYELPDAALAALDRAAQLLPTDVRWPYLAGLARAETRDLEGAAAAFRRALEVQPDHLPSRVRLGGILLAQGRAGEAAEQFRRGLESSPACARCAMGLGEAALASGDPAAAADHFRRALALQPQADSVGSSLAAALEAAGRSEEAAAAREAAGDTELIFYDPVVRWIRGVATGAGGHLQRGQRALETGDLEAALAALREAVASDPENALAQATLGRALLRTGEVREGLEALSVAIQLDPSDPGGYRELGDALAGAGLAREAAVTYRRGLVLAPGDPAMHLALARLLARSGEPRGAGVHFDRAVELAPDDPAVRYEGAMHRAATGDREGAVAELRRVAGEAGDGSGPPEALVRLNLAFLLELEGRDGEAREELARVLSAGAAPALQARAELALGRIAERAGDLGAAQRRYRASLDLAPLPPALLRLGSTLAAAGDYAAAADLYGRALEAVPAHRAGRIAHASALMLAARDAEAAASLGAGLERLPGDPYLGYQLALLRAAGGEAGVRDPEAALELARGAYAELANPVHGQALALAYAASGDFESAVRAQERIVAGLAPGDPLRPGAAGRLELLRDGRLPEAPWRDDPTLLYRPTVPVPRGEGP